MNERIIYKNPDGSLSIVVPAFECELDELAQKVVPPGIVWRVVGVSNLPEDRFFRDAWRDDVEGEQVDVFMPAAKEIALKKLRSERDKKLSGLDKLSFSVNSRGDVSEIQGLELKKQRLRDATEPLKALVVSGHNDYESLLALKSLSILRE